MCIWSPANMKLFWGFNQTQIKSVCQELEIILSIVSYQMSF